MTGSMRNFQEPDEDELPADIADRIAEETEDAGFTPNVFSAMAYKSSHFRAFFEYHDALVEDSTLEREEIEMIIVTVSGVNDCLYCTVAHGALLRVYSEDPQLADQLATNHRAAQLNPQHREMLDFAVQLTQSPETITREDLLVLRNDGFSEEAIWDIASVTAFFNLSNRLAVVADMRPNEEFYMIGR